jgi:hypothetical protein
MAVPHGPYDRRLQYPWLRKSFIVLGGKFSNPMGIVLSFLLLFRLHHLWK